MRRAVAIGVTALAVALPPPALAATQLRHFEGALPPVGVPMQQQPGGVLRLDVVFKDKRGQGKFTPRQLTAVNIDGMPVFCQPNTQGTLTGPFPTQAKFQVTGRKPGQAKPKRDSYTFSTSYSFTSFIGRIDTRIYKRQGKGPVLFFSTLTIDRIDLGEPGQDNCSSNGPRSASGKQV
jgi:hypothetical protein